MTQTTLDLTYKFSSPPDWNDYALLDSGDGERLERFDKYMLVRPEAEAIWEKSQPQSFWETAAARFVPSNEPNGGHWEKTSKMPDQWDISFRNLRFKLQLGGSKQIGIFPEQAGQWELLHELVQSAKKPVKVLNLFGYTGAASLMVAAAGASVTHVDSSRKAIDWGKANQTLSGVDNTKIRWIVDDALKFVKRESNRGAQYNGIIMDPPKFGRGPKGEVWEFYKWLPMLFQNIARILSPEPLFYLTTAYAVKASALTLRQGMQETLTSRGGSYQAGETILQEQNTGRLLSTSVYCLWTAS